MKQLLITIGIFLLLLNSANSAEYTIREGDTIDQIAPELGCSIKDLAALSNIKAPNYTVVIGKKIIYISKRELKDAKNWLNNRLFNLRNDSDEFKSFAKMLTDIKSGDIRYGEQDGTHASEILIFAASNI